MNHHVAVATSSYRHDEAEEAFDRVVEFAKAKSEEDLMKVPYEILLLGPCRGVMNDHVSFIMIPDGSKEWWATSDTANEIRDYFCEQMGAVSGVEVFVGSWGEMATTGDFVNGSNGSYLA